jgi:CheY-like chemotaxis protein
MERSILLIDDDKEMTDEVSEILADEGYRVTVANDGLAGDALLLKNCYDLVLLDLKMPGMDGFTVFKRLKKRNCDAKVIIVTAKPLDGDLTDGIDGLTAEDYELLRQVNGIVIKPYNIETLLKMIKKMTEDPAT